MISKSWNAIWVACWLGGVGVAVAADTLKDPIPITYTLKEAVERSIKQNLTLRAQQMEWGIAQWGKYREWGAFEPQISASSMRERNTRENTVEQENSQLSPLFEEKNGLSKLALEGLFVSGAKYSIGYTLNDLANSLTNRTSRPAFDSEYQSFVGASITQPLLKNAGLTTTMAGIHLANVQERIAYQDLRRQMMDIVSRTEAVYWELVQSQALYFNRVGSVKIATTILTDNRERVKTGKMPELEVFQAEAGLARRKIAREEARADWIVAMSRMRALFSDAPADPEPLLIVVDSKLVDDMHLDLRTSMYLAIDLQPDYLTRKYKLEQENVRLSYARNQRWPQIDLIGSYGFNGLGDSTGSSWDDIQTGDFESWSVGVQLTIPLCADLKSMSELHSARLRKKQALLNLKNTEVELHNAVDASIQRIKILRQSIQGYGVVVDYNKRLLDVELQRLETGKSDSRKVLAIEEELLTARDAYHRSRNGYRKSLLEFELTSGTILATRNLERVASQGDPDAESLKLDIDPEVRMLK